MDQLYKLLKRVLKSLQLYKFNLSKRLAVLLVILTILPNLVKAEGSKEIYVGSNFTGLLLCNDVLGHCNGGNGDRSQFATYDCDTLDRLYFIVNSTSEVVYLGFDPNSGGFGGNAWHSVYRIRSANGDIVKPEADVPQSGIGFINNITEAREGPAQLLTIGGYSALEWTPPYSGTFYIEFNRVFNNNPLNTSIGTFRQDLFDLTIADGSDKKEGRLYSYAWQFNSFSNGGSNSGKYFIYAADSIVTSLEMNDMSGGYWLLYCNQSGVGTTGDFTLDRMSVPNQQVYLPQYPIFLNEPDTVLFPPANTTGSIISPVTGTTDCDGTIEFSIEVDKGGNVDVDLSFDPPYTTRTISEKVVTGVNIITWDGFDGSTPTPLPVPNGENLSVTVTYINGLTNLPLYDVENNSLGFVVEMVSPAGVPTPTVYWDDSNIGSGGGGINLTGCVGVSSPWSGCHDWSDGDEHTMNTWWYTASATTSPVIMTEKRSPDSLIFNQPTQNYCADSSGIPISVTIDPNSESYHWYFTGNDVTITQVDTTDNFITIDLGPNATTGYISVYGWNAACGIGDTSQLFIGIQELPISNAGVDDTICVNQTVTLAGASTYSSSISWSSLGDGNFSSEIILNPVYTPGPGDLVNGNVDLILTAVSISPCTSSIADTMLLSFDPLPISEAGPNDTICENGIFTMAGVRTNSNSSVWATAGDGSFDDITSLTAIYTPGTNDIANGEVTLTLTTDAITPCTTPDIDDMTLTIDPLPVSDAGGDEVICINQTIILSGLRTNSSSSLWSTLGDGSFDDPLLLNAEYTPGVNDLTSGTVDLVLTANGELPCTDVDRDTMSVTINDLPVSVAGNDSTICISSNITLYGARSNSNSSLWSTLGDGSFDDSSLLAATYTPGASDQSSGSVELILTANPIAPCTDPVRDTLLLSFDPLPIADAGVDDTVCVNQTLTLSGQRTSSNASTWSTLGDGTFDDASLLNAIYTPGSNDILAGNVDVILTADAIFPCADADADTMNLAFDPLPIANAGIDDTICVNQNFTLSGSRTNSDASQWTTLGDGSFDDATSLVPIYTPGANDLVAGSVDLVLTADAISPCSDANADTMNLAFDALPIADAGLNDTICVNQTIVLSGARTNSNSSLWTSAGDGTFNDATILASEYTPGISDLATGTVTLSLTADAVSPCTDADTDDMILTFDPLPISNAGVDDTVCVNQTFALSGSITHSNSSIWTTLGDGSFDDPTSLSSTYSPGTADIASGSVDLILTANPISPCADTQNDTIALAFDPLPISDAGGNQNICLNTAITLSGTITNSNASLWSTSGDGTFDDVSLLTATYTPGTSDRAFGSVDLTLTASPLLPCTDSHDNTMTLSFDALPQPQISILPNDTVCVNSVTNFVGTDNSGLTIQSWGWDLADGTAAATQNTTHTYTVAMSDSVMLWAIDNIGCTDTIYRDIEVTDPLVGFDILIDTVCFEDTVNFVGTGDIVNYTQWLWDFGDGNIGTGRDTSHVYSLHGNYTVTLNVCSKSANADVLVYAKAVASAGSNHTICQDIPYDFSTSTILPDTISADSVLWFGGTGSFSNAKDLTPTYFNGPGELGLVPLSMIAYGKLPCSDDTSTMVLTIDSVPDGNFIYSPVDTSCVMEPVAFDASSSTIINTWDWDFGDGNLGSGKNTSHTYSFGDTTFYVTLSIANSFGCSRDISDSIYVDSVFTDFSIQSPAICYEDISVFTGTGDNITHTDWEWNFGDGTTAIGKDQTHYYTSPGLYDVTLNVCTDTTVRQVLVNTLPISDFTISPNDTSCMGEEVFFNASNTTSDIVTWNWQFGDGNISAGQNVSHTYNVIGDLNILSIYTNNNGCIDTTINSRIIQDINIGIGIFQSPSCQNYNVDLSGNLDRVTFTPYNWTFGDGSTTAVGLDVSHIYTVADTVDVILDVCSEQEVQQLIINAICEVDAGSNEITCQDVYFDMNDSQTPPTADNFSSIEWTALGGLGTFNDNTLIAPTYFPDPSEGSVVNDTILMRMVGEGIPPCINDTSYMELIVIPGAYAQAGSDENTCFGVPFDFANSTDSSFATNYVTLNWSTSGTGSFVDPSVTRPIYIPGPGEIGPVTLTMIASNIIACDSLDEMILTIRPTYEVPVDVTVCFYDSAFAQGQWRYVSGTYFDTLLTANYGCDSVIVTNLTVRPKVDRDFVISTGDSICNGETVSFTSVGSANLTDWLWDFGDGTTSNDMNPTHQYNVAGNFTVVYYYTDDNGCSDSALNQVQVFDLPDVSFTINMTNACVNTQVGFVGSSNSNIVSWDWDFGDGTTGAGQSTTHVYSTWGNLDVVLTVTDINGCNESFVRELNIAQPPVADFSYSPVVCDSMQFTDLSTSPAGYNLVQWFWDFGDGVGTSTLQNPSYQYPSNTTPGGEVFMVTLTVVADSNGFICSDSIVLPVTVPSLPDIFYTFTPDPTCLGDTTFFYGESGFPIDVWQWDFDDGNFSNDQDATHIFASTGDYDVVLTITDTNLCQNTLVNTVRVNDIPTVSFTVSDSVSCHGNQIGFISTVSSNVETWFWDFDDGSFSNDQNPVHYFPQGGNYNVSLTVTDSAGCSATFTDDVLILPGPTADFSYQNITCSSVLFTDLSTAPTGYTVTEWLWDFGDGFTSNIQNPSHSYTLGIGTYDVTLIVTADSSNYSCQDTIVQTIYTPGLPSVFFTWTPEPTMLGDLTSFFGTSGNTIIDWYWDFGDGNFATTQDATHTFATVGSFTVELTVTDIDGCQNSVIHQVTVTSIPELDFSWNYSCEGSPVQFTVLDPPTDLPAVVSFSWDFGDGGISDQQDPEHVYVTSGTYNVSLTIIDTMAATNTVVKQITVNPLPISLFSIGSQTCQGNDVSFTDYSTTQTGYITEWFWDFGDGNTQTVIFPNSGDVTHQYAATGNYVVTLTITNSDSCSNSSQNSVTILPSPTAMFTNTEGCQSTPIDFTDQSTQNGGGSIISWAWNFDDPGSGSDNTSTLQNPTHLFSSSGSFDVLLVVENINGCIDSITMSVTVEANPEVDFTWDNACVDADVEFTSDYTGGDATYSWTFGDGGTSNLPNPTYSYTTPGDYTVTLTITTTLGCVASSSHTVEIHPLPNANFAHTGPACLNQEVEFTNLSTSPNGTIDTWVWDFGDGTTVTINAPASPDVTHLYANDGTFDVVLTVTDVEGCESSVTKQVIVVNSPIADFTYDESCYNEPVIFTDISTTNSGTDIQSWYWDFGDPASGTNNTSNLQNPSHVFTSPGTYTTTLIIVSTFGCSDTTTKDVEVEELPFAEIGMLDDSICLGELAEFTGTGSDISTWYWEFGDGGTSIEQNPSYMYAQTGIYIVSLTVTGTGTDQCTYTTDTTITVNDAPQADFSYENTCLGDSTYFTDLSYSQYGFISEWLWDFGDGSTSTLEDPSHVYLTNDDFQVTLIVTDNFGCSDTLSQWIQVFGSPIPSFSWDQVCDPVGQVNFFDQSTPGLDNSPIVGWEWHLDDGYFSTEIDPSYIYSIIDTCYTVTLTVTDNNGCYSTDTNTQVCLHGELEVDFTTDVVCENQSTLFTATYSPGSDSVASYSWNFNDGTPIVSTYYDTITHIFPNAGMYIVELTALDTNDCVATIYKEVMVDSLPTAQFTYDQGSCENPTEFTDISLGGGEFIQSWYWDFGDLTSSDNTSTLQNPTHMYPPNDSVYTVKLVITNFNGCMDSIEQQVFVDPCLIAGFVIPDTACARYEMCFRDTSSVASSTSQVSEWRWDFGDGTTYNYTTYDEYVCHTFSQAGDYPVELVILANIGGTTYSDTVTKMVRVNPTPVAIMDYTNGCFGDTTMFYDASASYGAPIIYYHWDLGDPNTSVDTSLMQDTMYVYPDYGTYYPELIVQNEFTCSDTIGDTITIYKLPTAEFSFEEQCMSYYTYFTDESTNDSSSISSWYWDFGHGTFPGDTSIDQDPVFIYDTTGVYTTSLIVTDANGCIDSTSRDIDIWPIPQTNFVVIDTNQQGQIYLDNLSQGGVDYYWDFDYDYGVSTTEKSPIHQYEVDGSYDIMLVSYNEYNCPDTMHQIYDLLFRNLFVPNAFIPSSSDQELRTFLPKGINLRSYTIEIYSSWGNRVFESTELNDGTPAEGWDGTYKDEPLPTGSYIWRISAVFEDGEYWKGTDNGDGNTGTSGTITLIR